MSSADNVEVKLPAGVTCNVDVSGVGGKTGKPLYASDPTNEDGAGYTLPPGKDELHSSVPSFKHQS